MKEKFSFFTKTESKLPPGKPEFKFKIGLSQFGLAPWFNFITVSNKFLAYDHILTKKKLATRSGKDKLDT